MDQSNMLEGAHDLNGFMPGEDLADGTSAAHAGGSNGSVSGFKQQYGPTTLNPDTHMESSAPGGFSAADLARGYKEISVERTPMFDDGSSENPTGDAFAAGGILGRPRGTSR